MFTPSTSHGNHGPTHTLLLCDGRCAKLVPPELFGMKPDSSC